MVIAINFYIGLTNDILDRESRHHAAAFIEHNRPTSEGENIKAKAKAEKHLLFLTARF